MTFAFPSAPAPHTTADAEEPHVVISSTLVKSPREGARAVARLGRRVSSIEPARVVYLPHCFLARQPLHASFFIQ